MKDRIAKIHSEQTQSREEMLWMTLTDIDIVQNQEEEEEEDNCCQGKNDGLETVQLLKIKNPTANVSLKNLK